MRTLLAALVLLAGLAPLGPAASGQSANPQIWRSEPAATGEGT